MRVLIKMCIVVWVLFFTSGVSMATSSAKGIVYIPVGMSDEATVIMLPKDRVIFIPVPYTGWFSSGSWPYYALTTPYYGYSGLSKEGRGKEDLNCLSGVGLRIGVNLEVIKDDKSRDVVKLDVTQCEGDARYLVDLAFESIRLTANDERIKRVRPRVVVIGKKKDVEKWGEVMKEINAHDFTKPYKRKEESVK